VALQKMEGNDQDRHDLAGNAKTRKEAILWKVDGQEPVSDAERTDEHADKVNEKVEICRH
jgi:hypothetical protein